MRKTMSYIKLILIGLIVSVSACGGDKSSSGDSGNNSSGVVKDKISVSVELTGNGKNWAGIEGCLGKIVYINGMDSTVDVHIIRYEVKHTSDSGLQIGIPSERTIETNETRKIDASFSAINCDEITGLEMQAFTCKTEAGFDCVENYNFVSTSDVALTVNKQN